MARVMLAHLGDAANVRGMLEPFQPAPTTNGERFTLRGILETFGGVLEHLAGDQTSTNHGATFAGQCWNTVQHHGGNLRGCWHGWQDQTNQPAPTTGGNVSPPFCNVSPPFFRNPQNAPLPTTGATFAGMLPTFGRSNQRSVLTGAIFGAILAHSPHVVGCIY